MVFERYHGDAFLPIDTFKISSDTVLSIKADFPRGLFAFRWVKNGNPAEFVYSPKEKALKIEADYWTLMDGQLAISNSTENIAYGELLGIHAKYAPRVEDTEMRLNALTPFMADYKKQVNAGEAEVERLMIAEREELSQIKVLYPGTFASDILLPLTAKPSRSMIPDGMQKFDSYVSFLHQHYFMLYPFGNEEILNHYAFQESIFLYLSKNTETSTSGAQEGIDIVMGSLKDNDKVNSFVYNSLLTTFLKLNAEKLVKHLMENHSSGCALDLSLDDLKKLDAIKALEIGSKAPDVLLYDDGEKAQSLYTFAGKNKYTVIYFWLSWCTSCKKQTPLLRAAYEKYSKKGLGVFTISLDEDKQEWISTMKPTEKSWVNVSELVPIPQSSYVKKYAISTTPKIIIVDKDGNIVAKDVYGETLQGTLGQLFGE